jgi:hypothetical protein
MEVTATQALVVQLGSTVSDDNLTDDDPDLLSFDVAEFEIVCQMSSRLSRCWPDSGKPDCLVWDFGWSGFYDP